VAAGAGPAPDARVTWPEEAALASAASAASAEAAAAEAETPEEVPFWDLSAAGQPGDDPDEGYRWERVVDGPPSGDHGSEPAERTEPPRAEWKPVVTPLEEAGKPQRPGIGQGRGDLAHLSANPRMRVWQLRAVVAVVILVAFSIVASWQLGLTLAVLAVIADTIYRSRRPSSRKVRMTGAQRRTRRQLAKLDRAGYRAMHASPIPDSEDQIDHLVVGPAGVFAIDSEDWDKRLIVRTKSGRQLWHGPFSKKDRLEHALWEAQRAADLLSGEVGKPVTVRPAMAVYGPKIPWDVATIRDVDVFSGSRLRRYLRRRARNGDVRPLTEDEIERIFKAANRAFPHHLSSGSPAG